MTAHAPSPLAARPLARRVEVISGILALLTGLGAIGYRLLSPLVTVHVYGGPSGYMTVYRSYWTITHGFAGEWLGLAMLGLCVLALLAVGYGAYTHGAHQTPLGRLFLWSGAALVVLVIVLAEIVGNPQLDPEHLVALYLVPAGGLALLASGAALCEPGT